MPQAPPTPPGPSVKLAMESDKNRLRTFPSLMTTPYEEQLLEWHATGQLALVNVGSGSVKKIGKPAMIRAIDVSPDGKYTRVTRMTRPFSYDVPVGSFGQVEEIWDDQGTALAKVGERALNLGVQDDTQPVDPQAPPAGGGGGRGGDAAANANPTAPTANTDDEPPARGGRGQGPQRKDRVYQWNAPFAGADQKVIYENPTRINGHRYSPDMSILFFSERDGQNSVESAVYLADTAKKYQLARYRTDDVYANPGSIVSVRGGGGGGRAGGAGGGRGGGGAAGPVLLSADGAHVFFQGSV